MPEIAAFRGLRYDLGHVGELSNVVAPPYDVIDDQLRDELYKKHPANVIRLILNREEPGDDQSSNRYSRAARFLKNWRREGVLQTEPDPAIYVYHQVFEADGQAFTRRGFMCRVRLERFGEGKIYPHEETHSSAKADRLKLTNACRANLSQIFGLYPDAENQAQEILEAKIEGVAPLEATDHLGIVHRIWPVTEVSSIGETAAVLAPKAMYIADGHHRYETACNYRDQLASAGPLPVDHPANFVLTMCVSMHDPGMIVLPTHRLLHGIEPLSSDQLIERIGGCFSTRVAGEGPDLADSIWESIQVEDRQGMIGLYCQADQRWVVAEINEQGIRRMAEIAAEHSSDWQGLGVAVLHHLIVKDLLGIADLSKPKYVHRVDEIVEGLESGNFQMAALVMPATLDHIRAISEHGERMPAKSTYFYPKLLSGLVINPLE